VVGGSNPLTPTYNNEVGKLSRKGFLPRFICSLTPFLNLQIAEKCSNTVATVCFANIRFQHRHITLPFFERDWQCLKTRLRQHSLPKVQFAAKAMPKRFIRESRYPFTGRMNNATTLPF
jgi:hypothetical protein